MLTVLGAAAHQRSWALRLWACPQVPQQPGDLRAQGHLVEGIGLPPIGEIADETEGFSVVGFAGQLAGRAGQVMVLALAAARTAVSLTCRTSQFARARGISCSRG